MGTKHNPEEIIERIGGCGKFQVFLSVMSHLLKLPTVLTMYLMVFSIATPTWRCGDPDEERPPASTLNTTIHNVTFVIGNDISGVSLDSDNSSSTYDNFKNCKNRNGTHCKNIIYDGEMKTIVSEWSMSCDLPWVPSTIASIQMLGIFFGNLVSGQLADSFGRKFPLFASLLLLTVANLTGYFSSSWIVFGVARALCGVGMGGYLTVQYSLVTEVTLAKWRPLIVAFPTWKIMGCGFALVSYLMPDWRKLHILTTVATVPFLFLWWFFPESFRWHLSHDRTHRAKYIIQRIGKFNNRSVSDETVMDLLNTTVLDTTSGDKMKYSIIHLFKTRKLAIITCLSSVNWLALGLLSYGIQFGIQALSGNFFLNIFMFSIISVPATFIAIYLSNRYGPQRFLNQWFCLICKSRYKYCLGTRSADDSRVVSDLCQNTREVARVHQTLARLVAVVTLCLEFVYSLYRNIGYGLLNTFVRIGAVIGPQLAFLDTRVPGVMYFICCGVSVCCIIASMLLSETKGADLDDKIVRRDHNSKDISLNS